MQKSRSIIVCLGLVLAGSATCFGAPAEEPAGVSAKQDTKTNTESKATDDKGTTGPKLALGGYCPACYLIDKKAIKGDPKFSSEFRGRTYYSSSAERKAAFDADPDKYLPQFDGLCTLALGGSIGGHIPGDPKIFTIEKGKYYLFSSMRAYRDFFDSPEQFLLVARSRFDRPMLRGFCPVSLLAQHRAVRGDARYSAVYDGKLYYFVDSMMKAMFDKSPDQYVPLYDGYDPNALSKRAKVKGSPHVFLIWKGHIVVFIDEDAKKAFEADPEGISKKADEAWKDFSLEKPH